MLDAEPRFLQCADDDGKISSIIEEGDQHLALTGNPDSYTQLALIGTDNLIGDNLGSEKVRESNRKLES